jgi:predicted permease
VALVGFFVLCGVGALIAAFVMGRFLWRDEQRFSAVLVGSLTATTGLFCLASAWIWWDGPLF